MSCKLPNLISKNIFEKCFMILFQIFAKVCISLFMEESIILCFCKKWSLILNEEEEIN